MGDNKISIDETIDMINFVDTYFDNLGGGKSYAEALVATTGEGVAALVGSWKIPEELKDLDEAEKTQLLTMSIPVLMKVAKFFAGKK